MYVKAVHRLQAFPMLTSASRGPSAIAELLVELRHGKDGQRDGHWHRSISARCITSRAKNLQSMNDLDIQVTTKVIKVAAIK